MSCSAGTHLGTNQQTAVSGQGGWRVPTRQAKARTSRGQRWGTARVAALELHTKGRVSVSSHAASKASPRSGLDTPRRAPHPKPPQQPRPRGEFPRPREPRGLPGAARAAETWQDWSPGGGNLPGGEKTARCSAPGRESVCPQSRRCRTLRFDVCGRDPAVKASPPLGPGQPSGLHACGSAAPRRHARGKEPRFNQGFSFSSLLPSPHRPPGQ